MIGTLLNWFRRRRALRDLDLDLSTFGESWTCHICGARRPDARISVHSTPIVFEGKTFGQRNVRYCNDSAACAAGAQEFRFTKDGPL